MCLIYFSSCVDLVRKLNIFVLEETKVEACFVKCQFIIFFLAYSSKIITLMYWIRNPPIDRDYQDDFLINVDAMTVAWVFVPFVFLLIMQIRSFSKMKEEKTQLLLEVEQNAELTHPTDRLTNLKLNKSYAENT